MHYKIKEANRKHAPLEREFLKLALPVASFASFINSQAIAGIMLFVSAVIAIVMVHFG